MQSFPPKSKTLDKSLCSKTITIQNNPNLKLQVKSYFLQTYQLYQKLFEVINSDQAYYIRAQPLRHPLIFYYAHTATVYVNKFIDHGIIRERINPLYEKMFAVGVDQMDWDDLNASHYDWPSFQNAKGFRSQVKKMVLNIIDGTNSTQIDSWMNELWVVLMGIQHQRIHLETSAVIIRRVPLSYLKPVEIFVQCEIQLHQLNKLPQNKMVKVSDWKGQWERRKEKAETYGWDNQFGVKYFDVKGFKASQMLVSNGQFLQFIDDGGYQRPQIWSEEGQRWIQSIKPQLPIFWRKNGSKYQLRTLSSQIDMPWDWPAQVNNLQARAFCKWKTLKTGKYIRLPTEDEYYAIRHSLKKDQTNWEYQSAGNINLQFWISPNPVNLFKTGDFFDVVGNVWQHTLTPIYPFSQFEIHPTYDDFSTPTFDERHDLIKGGSFISTGNEALYHARYAFRRHFYQFAGFRYIQTDIKMQVDIHSTEAISDKNVQLSLKHHYLSNNSYVLEVVQEIKRKLSQKVKDKRVLTVGCSVGRIPIQMGKIFGESFGVDYTARYFQMSTRLQEKGFLKFKDIDINLQSLKINNSRVSLLQMNPQNPDEKKINNFDWVIVDGFSLKKQSLSQVLKKIVKLTNKEAIIAVVNVQGRNKLSKQETKKLLGKASNTDVETGEEIRLAASDSDQSYLPDWERQLVFTLNYYTLAQN